MSHWLKCISCLLSFSILGPSVWAETPSVVVQKITDACEAPLTGNDLARAQELWSGKVVLFDTNVLLNDPHAIYKYPGADIVIPGTVLEEIDDKKSDENLGKAARTFSRLMDGFIKKGGNLRKGIEIMPNTKLRVDTRNMTHFMEESSYDPKKRDNEIIALALAYTYERTGNDNTILVSDDINVRVKAASEEVLSIPFEYEWVTSAKDIKQEYSVLNVSKSDLERFLAEGILPKPADFKIAPNEFVMLRTEDFEGSPDTLARYFYDRKDPAASRLQKLPDFSKSKVQPKNLEQAMLLDVLLDESIDLVISEALFGTGKTFVTLAAGLMQLPDTALPRYENILITKPMVTLDNAKVGALPGTMNEKMAEDYNSYYDNMRVLKKLLSPSKSGSGNGQSAYTSKKQRRQAELAAMTGQSANAAKEVAKGPVNEEAGDKDEKPKLRIDPNKNKPVSIPGVDLLSFSHVRGRSLHHTFLIVDEAQNISLHGAKTILTRLGEGSKAVMLGDITQIDLPFLNERNNGLSVTASLFTAEDLSDEDRSRIAFVRLKESVRSEFTKLASRVFQKKAKPE